MRMKYLFLILALTACSSVNQGSIDNATILNWENDAVTTEQFIRDHKSCLGIKTKDYQPRSRIANCYPQTKAHKCQIGMVCG